MIASISGVVQDWTTDSLTVLVGGIGLRVWVPSSVVESAGSVGRTVTLHTHLHWRENEISLYGLNTADELALFELLLGTSGIGPRLALAILSTLSPDLLRSAVLHEEPGVLQRVPGIGKKTAERILFHLRDRLELDRMAVVSGPLDTVDADVVAALTTLGYSAVEAHTALQRLPRDPELSLEDRIRLALVSLSR
jgi:Holliday junction DNA helicase RuvA